MTDQPPRKKCKSCEDKNIKILAGDELQGHLDEVHNWKCLDGRKITRIFIFKNFISAIQFVDMVADIAEEEGHHPDIKINYNKVTLELTTHSIGGLSDNDFIVATKIDLL